MQSLRAPYTLSLSGLLCPAATSAFSTSLKGMSSWIGLACAAVRGFVRSSGP